MRTRQTLVYGLLAVILALAFTACSGGGDPGGPPPVTLTGITAEYTQTKAVFPATELDDLKEDLAVTAAYSDSTSKTLASADYTLSGTLTVGSSEITVTYQGKTDIFDVTVTAPISGISIKTQPTNLSYTHGDALDLDGLVVTLQYEDETIEDEDIEFADFGTIISAVPADGAILNHTGHNGQPVTVHCGSETADTNNLTVDKKALTVAEAVHTKPYDGTTSASGVTVTLGGIVGSEDVSPDTVTAEYTAAVAGTTNINITGITLTGEDAGNYTITLPASSITVTGGGITKATPTVTWPTAAAITYGSALSTSELSGGVGAGTFAWTNGATIPTVTNSGYDVTFTPTDTANYNPANSMVSIAVNQKALTVTGASHTKPYDTTTTANGVTVTLGGIVSGDDVSADTVAAEYTAAAALTTTVNITGVTLTGTYADNYTVTLPANNITVAGITKADPAVIWPTAATIFNNQTLANAVFTGGSGAGTFAYTNATFTVTVANSGTAYEVTFTPTDTANFNTATNNVSITVVYAIGDTGPGGGRIFYYSADGFTVEMVNPAENYTAHYLEAAPSDIVTNLTWASNDSGTWIEITSTAIGTGRKNTALILSIDINAPAAKACTEYENNSHTDWFLPSKDELNELYKQKDLFTNWTISEWDFYWSSSQQDNANPNQIWAQGFVISNSQGISHTSTPNSVRTIRAF